MAIVVVIFLIAGLTALWAKGQIWPGGEPGDEVTFEVQTGWSGKQVVEELSKAGIVGNSAVANLYFKFAGNGRYEAGNYQMNKNLGAAKALKVIEQGPQQRFDTLTIPEGYTLTQTAARVAEIGRDPNLFIQAGRNGTVKSKFEPAEQLNIEGLFFPDTYQVGTDETPEQVLQEMVKRFDDIATELNIEAGAAALGRTPYEIVIIASMIEREARVPEDREKISRVIYNRLAQDMVLNIDATVRYGVGKPSDPLTQSDLQTDGPYNTYTRKGLPPTPIAAPGRASLEAALHPADGEWLFYVVADTSGRHVFTNTYQEHLVEVEKARQAGVL